MTPPSMTERQIALVKADFALVAPAAERFARRFYEILFAQAPWTQGLFRNTDTTSQAGKLAGALALLVANLEQPAAITVPLQQLGAKHVGFGVTEAHYGDVAGALLATLRETVGAAAWIPEREAAWTAAYMIAAVAMQQGAAAAAGPRAA